VIFQTILSRTPIGWLQLRRNKARFFVALGGIAFADLLMFMQLGVLGAALDTSALLNNLLQADIVLISPEARDIQNSATIPRSRLYQAEGQPGIASGTAMYLGFLDWRSPFNAERRSMLIVGTDPDNPGIGLVDVQRQKESLKRPDTVIFDRLSRGNYPVTLKQLDKGQPVTAEIDRRTLTVIGTFRLGAAFGLDGTLIGSETTFLHLFPTRSPKSITLGLLRVSPGQDPIAVAALLKSKMTDDVDVMTRAEFVQHAKTYQGKHTPIGFIFGLGTVMGFIVGMVMVYQVLSTDVADHLAEYATFKAMGFTNAYLVGIIVEECFILATIGFVPGLIAGEGLMKLMHIATALPTSLPFSRMVLVFLLTFVLCMVSGIIASRRLRKADPAEVFA
jgi:putative ABC transport system permease protein